MIIIKEIHYKNFKTRQLGYHWDERYFFPSKSPLMQQLGKLHSANKYRDKVLLESAIR